MKRSIGLGKPEPPQLGLKAASLPLCLAPVLSLEASAPWDRGQAHVGQRAQVTTWHSPPAVALHNQTIETCVLKQSQVKGRRQ